MEMPVPPDIDIQCSSCGQKVIDGKMTCWCVPIHKSIMAAVVILFPIELILFAIYARR